MDFEKAVWTTDGDHLNVTMPICKVNQEKRTVTGFATLDNVDTQNDIVTADASEKAFSQWRGNVREQHMEHKAVGKLLSFKPEKYYDDSTGKTYNGIFVETYISKGAPDTWEKVLDGTLTGFSLGGGINKAQNVFEKTADGEKRVRKVVDYTITELSLVDNPANQLANIISFQKQANGETSVSGILVDTDIENIFYCKDDEVAITSDEEALECVHCQKLMTNIGFVETSNEDLEKAVKSAVNKFNLSDSFALEKNLKDNVNNITINIEGNQDEIVKRILKSLNVEGGVKVAEEKDDATEEVVEQPAEGDATEGGDAEGEQVDEVVEDGQAADVSEAEDVDFSKMFSDLTDSLTNAINSAKEETTTAITNVKDEFEKAVGEVKTEFSELVSKVNGLEEKVDSSTTQLGDVEKRIDGVVSKTAMKKSGDLGGESDGPGSIWDGAFLPLS